jgi:ubiquinone/menaquinone biosynthesis C-methylase UbiE
MGPWENGSEQDQARIWLGKNGGQGMDHSSKVQEEFTRQAATISVAPVFTDSGVLEQIYGAVKPTKTMNLLDLGCGPGIVTAALAPDLQEVVAYDLTPEMLTQARQRCGKAGLKNVRFEVGRAEQLPFENESFDGVVTRLTIHHFLDPQRVLNEVVRVMRPKGKLVVADVVSSENEEEEALHNALEILRDPTHVRMFSPRGLQELLQASGLRIASQATWEMKRDYDEWIRIANAPERVKPLYVVMANLARAGLQAGIHLHCEGKTVAFTHKWLLITAKK